MLKKKVFRGERGREGCPGCGQMENNGFLVNSVFLFGRMVVQQGSTKQAAQRRTSKGF